MRTAQTTYLSRLDHLRFLAAALVVLFHFFHSHVGDLRGGNPLVSLIDEGHTGIALFMVISGFIFTVIAGDREVRYGAFLRNRILRIYPLFTVAVFLQLLISTYNNHANYGFLQLIGWLMPFRSETVPLSPYFSQLWTIWVEFQFYLMFPFLLAFARRLGPRYLLGLLLLLTLLRLLVFAASGSVRFLAYETIFGRLDQFLIGMLLGLVWLHRSSRAAGLSPAWLVLAMLGVLTGLHLFSRKVGYSELDSAFWIVWPLVEGLMWAGVVWTYLLARWPGPAGLRARIDRMLAALGAVSFSTYILHNLVIAAYNKNLPLLPWGPGTAREAILTGVVLILPAVLLLSMLTYHLIEKPFLAMRGTYLSPRD